MTLPPVVSRRLALAALLLYSLCGVYFVFTMMPNGVGATIDSAIAMSGARSLFQLGDMLTWWRVPLTEYPPLHPVFLGVLALAADALNLNLMRVLALAHAVIFAATLLIAGHFLLTHLRFKPLMWPSLLALFNFPVLFTYVYLWTETTFNLLVLLFSVLLVGFALRPTRHRLVALTITAALVCLGRYIGVFVVPAGVGAILLLKTVPPRQTRLNALGFAIGALLPVGLWMARNALMTGNPTFTYQESPVDLFTNTRLTLQIIVSWFTSLDFETLPAAPEAGVLFLAGLGLVVWAAFRWRSRAALALLLIILSYGAAIIVLATRYNFGGLNHRYVSPIYPVIVLALALALDEGLARLPRRKQALSWVAAGFVTLWAINFPWYRANNELYTSLLPWCCMEPAWSQSGVYSWLDEHSPEGTIVSNTPLPLYYARPYLSIAPSDLADWEGKSAVLVWLEYAHYQQVSYTLADLKSSYSVETLAEFPDGGIYRVTNKRSVNNDVAAE
jgi:hypothetical protein